MAIRHWIKEAERFVPKYSAFIARIAHWAKTIFSIVISFINNDKGISQDDLEKYLILFLRLLDEPIITIRSERQRYT